MFRWRGKSTGGKKGYASIPVEPMTPTLYEPPKMIEIDGDVKEHLTTGLHVAVETFDMERLQTLLKAYPSQDNLNSPDSDGNAPLHLAVKSLNSEAVAALLDAGANPNVRNNHGQSPLHLLAYAASSPTSSDQLIRVTKCTDALLQSPILDIEALNNSKMTPLQAAARQFPCKASSLEVLCKKLVELGAIVDSNTRALLDMHCVPKIIYEEATASYSQTVVAKLLNAVILNQPEVIEEVLKPGQQDREIRTAANCYFGRDKILDYVVTCGNDSVVEALLNAGADPWAMNRYGKFALHRALARGNHKVVDMLINEMKKKNRNGVADLRDQSFTLMKKAFCTKMNDKCESDIYDPNKCLQRLFESDVLLNVNQRNNMQRTALHLAGEINNQEVMAILLEHGAHLGDNRDIWDDWTDFNVLPPKTLNKLMDNCIKFNSQTENSENNTSFLDYTLEMNYQLFLPPYTACHRENEVYLLYKLSQSNEQRNAIKHPLIQTFLHAKWRKFLPLYFINVFLNLVLVILLTVYMHRLKDLRVLESMAEAGNYTAAAVVQEEIPRHEAIEKKIMAFVLILTLYMVAKEMFQIGVTRKRYFHYIKNYLEWFLILSVLVAWNQQLSLPVTRHLAAWTMIVAWYQFVLALGQAPHLAIYITMLRHVSWNFLKVISLFGFLIIAFSLSFSMILQPSENLQSGTFTDFWVNLPRAIVMSTGEFEYMNFTERLATNSIVYATSAVLIFLVFLFLIYLVLMNVMTGLAVTDAKEIVGDAELYSLKSRLEFVYLNEDFFIKVPFLRRFLPCLQLLYNEDRRLLVNIKKLHKKKIKMLSHAKPKEHHQIPKGVHQLCLDNHTAKAIRIPRLNNIAALHEEHEQEPTEQILHLLQDVRNRLVTCDPNSAPRPGAVA